MRRRRAAADPLPPPTPSEAAFEELLAHLEAEDATPDRHPERSGEAAKSRDGEERATASDAAAFLAELFAQRRTYLDRDPYATIGEASGFNTKIVGVTFEGRQDLVAVLQPGAELALVREPDNAHDPHAIAVHYGTLRLGYVRRAIAARIAPNLDAGERYTAEVRHVTGGGTRSVGVNIWVERARPLGTRRPGAERARSEDVLAALIGRQPLRDAQHAVLEHIAAGRNTLAVLGTGRGKSLCYQYPGAVGALEAGTRTLVLYPLRALVNDQYEGLVRRLEPLGLRIFRANGALESGERAALMEALQTGAWDLVCATPEFVHYHVERFSAVEYRPTLLVIDEAHHVVESTHRPAYGGIGAVIRALGGPQVIALTATAGEEAFVGIRRALAIEAWVIDPTVRTNLTVVDARNATNKLAYIAREIGTDGKAIVYCNSRHEVTQLAEKLRSRVGDRAAFYHAGVGVAERAQVEAFFRSGEIRVVVATTAFGEGIDLPDVRNVFLYHLNFDLTEFNQQAGRAGRDGAAARIHLLFGERDRGINDFILERQSPTAATLRAIYRGLRGLARDGILRATHDDTAALLELGDRVTGTTVATALRIFADLDLVEPGEDDDGRYVAFRPTTERVDLARSERFAEGEAERESFRRFCALALTARPEVLQAVINRPIYPADVPLRHPGLRSPAPRS